MKLWSLLNSPQTITPFFDKNLFTPIFLLKIRPLLGETNFTLDPDPKLFFLFFDTVLLLPSIGALRALSKLSQ